MKNFSLKRALTPFIHPTETVVILKSKTWENNDFEEMGQRFIKTSLQFLILEFA